MVTIALKGFLKYNLTIFIEGKLHTESVRIKEKRYHNYNLHQVNIDSLYL